MKDIKLGDYRHEPDYWHPEQMKLTLIVIGLSINISLLIFSFGVFGILKLVELKNID